MATTTIQRPAEQHSPKTPAPRDFRQEVTDSILRMLENGVAPWQKPWESGATSLGIPMNPTTERSYRGGNAIHLMATALRNGYEDPRWMTYNQASEKGWQVRRGEKGTQIEFWDVKSGPDRPDAAQNRNAGESSAAENGQDKPRLVHRVYTVFNGQQIERIPPYIPKQHTTFQAVHAGEQILKNSEARIAHDQADRAFYSREEDSIHLPPKNAFKDPAGYYGTALHELAHWTGHPSRLNRSTLNESYRFGNVSYAREELRAELASVFLAAERGIPHNPEQHAAYVGSWIKALQQDKNEIFRAAHDASRATDFLLSLERERSIADEELGVDVDSPSSTAVSAATLEQETEEVHRDRERLEEESATSENAKEYPSSARESLESVARYEPGSGTVNVHAKQSTTDRRTTVEVPVASSGLNGNSKETDTVAESLRKAQAIAVRSLGDSAKTLPAQTESGAYRGPIVGETEHHIVQRQSRNSAVAHLKDLLDRQPGMGETVRISYSNDHGLVSQFRDRVKGKELSR